MKGDSAWPTPEWLNTRNFFFLLIILAMLPHLQTLDFGFVADDNIYLGISNRVFWELDWGRLGLLLQKPMNPWEFLPVRDFSYWLDTRVFGGDSGGFHASNLVWYLFSCVAVFWASMETLRWSNPEWSERIVPLAALAAAFFAWHPAHVEPVAWIAGRKDLLAGIFSILAWGSLMRAMRNNYSIACLAGATLCLVLACFSKGAAVATAALLACVSVLCLSTIPRGSRRRAVIWCLLVMLVGALIGGLHSAIGQRTGIQIENAPGAWVMLERASRILAVLLTMIFFPLELGVIHDVYGLGVWHWGASVLVLICAGFAFHRLLNGRSRLFAVGVLWVLLPCVLYLQLLPFSTWSMASERFVFQAVFGAALLLLGLIGNLRQPLLAVALVGAMVGTFAVLVVQRVPAWSYEANLWQAEAARNPTYFNAVQNQVMILALRGRIAEAETLVDGVTRADAKAVLRAYIAVRRPPARLAADAASKAQAQKEVCRSGRDALVLIEHEFGKIPLERDIPYNNLLRNLKRSIDPDQRLTRFCARLAL